MLTADVRALVTALQEDFDRAFSLPLPERDGAPRPILRVVAGGHEMALALDDISGMHLDPRLARVPAAPNHLLGLATVRGRAWPVHDLAVLLGYGPASRPRVLCLMRGEPQAAFACETFRGLVHVRPEAVVDAPPSVGSRKAVKIGDDFIRLLDPSSLLQSS
jgi:chemotaxis signal transduction protein